MNKTEESTEEIVHQESFILLMMISFLLHLVRLVQAKTNFEQTQRRSEIKIQMERLENSIWTLYGDKEIRFRHPKAFAESRLTFAVEGKFIIQTHAP